MYTLSFKKVHPDARLPKRGSEGAAGLDLFAYDTGILLPTGRKLIRTGLRIEHMPRLTYGRIAPRSGLALNHGIDILAGVIDNDYRGEIGVVMINLGHNEYIINTYDRIAQLIIEQYLPCVATDVDQPLTGEDDAPIRGSAGFGSTGV